MARHPATGVVRYNEAHMKVIAVVSQKGGAGKTTLTLALAGHALSLGQRVVILDLDPQASACSFSTFRERAGLDDDRLIIESANAAVLDKKIAAATKVGIDVVVIDTAPHDAPSAMEATERADVVLVPCRAGAFDIVSISQTIKMATLAGKRPVVVINATRPNSRQPHEVFSAVATMKVADISPHHLSHRQDFIDAVTAGQVVQEYARDSKAAAEATACESSFATVANTRAPTRASARR